MTDQEEARSEAGRLKDAIGNGEAMRGLLSTPGGELLRAQLHDRYLMLVMAAARESEKYSVAIRTLEETASFIGDTLRIADVAREQLERLMRGTADEEY